jgi:LPXTG-motif cell wall-anchored protein/uncharacterized repeat protein (TIGR01451 family)
MNKLQAAHHRLRRYAGLALVALVGASSLALLAPTAARADAGAAILLQRTTAIPVLTGLGINYDLFFSCGAVIDPTCNNSRIELELPSYAYLSTGTHPYITNATRTATGYTITLSPTIPAGSSAKFALSISTPNGTTPSSTFAPRATVFLDGGTPFVSTSDASVTASSNVGVYKTVAGAAIIGASTRYELRTCTTAGNPDNGQLWFQTGRLVDTLPAGAVYVASSGGTYNSTTNTVTWTGLSNLGTNSCSASDSVDAWVDVRYNTPTFTTASTVTNNALVGGTPYGGSSELTATTSISHGFLSGTPAGRVEKSAFAPGATCDFRPCSYPGNWRDGQGDEAVWSLYMSNTSGVPAEVDLVDTLPCRLAPNGVGGFFENIIANQRYTTRPVGAGCTSPLFTVEALRLTAAQAVTPAGVAFTTAYQAGWRPTYLSSSGATGVFESTDLRVFLPVGLPVGDRIAEVTLPRDSRFVMPANSLFFIELPGHLPELSPAPMPLPASMANGQHYMENAVRYRMFSGAAVVVTSTDTESMAAKPPFKVASQFLQSYQYSSYGELTVQNYSPVPVPMVAAILLPPFISGQNVGLYGGIGTASPGHVSVSTAFTTEVIANFKGTGRDLIRLASKPGMTIDPFSGIIMSFEFGNLSSYPAGDVNFDYYMSFPGQSVDGCVGIVGQYSGIANGSTGSTTSDPLDVDGDGRTTQNMCRTPLFKRIPAGSSSQPALRTSTFVRGDLDTAEVASPNVATISDGGSAAYRINVQNTGTGSLTNVWVYDVLPYIGDRGISSSSISTLRGSAFQPTMTSAGVTSTVAGTTIEYSTSNNPCRPEVGVTTSCNAAPAWTTTPADWTTVRSYRALVPTLGAAGSATLAFTLVSPAGVASGATAWNNVAATGTDGASQLIPAESPKAGMGRPLSDVSIRALIDGAATSSAVTSELRTVTITAKHDTTVTNGAGGALIYSSPAVSTARSVTAAVTIPPGLELVAGSVTGTGFNSTTGVWTLGDMFVGSSQTVTFQVRGATSGNYSIGTQITANTVGDLDSTPNDCSFGSPVEDDCSVTQLTVTQPSVALRTLVESAPGTNTFIDANTGDPAGQYTSGQPVRYRFEITNNGTLTLSNISVIQAQLAAVCPLTTTVTLSAGQSTNINCTWSFGYAAGTTVLSATARGSNSGVQATAVDSAAVNVVLAPPPPASMSIDVTVVDGNDDASDSHQVLSGASMKWRYVITNTGQDSVWSITAADAALVPVNLAACVRSDGAAAGTPLPASATITCEYPFSAVEGGESRSIVARGFSSGGAPLNDTDSSTYSAGTIAYAVELQTYDALNAAWDDADLADGYRPKVVLGGDSSWRVQVTNSGSLALIGASLESAGLCATTTVPDVPAATTITVTCQTLPESVLGTNDQVVTLSHPLGSDAVDDAGVSIVQALDIQLLVKSSPTGAYIEADASDGLSGNFSPGDQVDWRVIVSNNTSASVNGVVVDTPWLTGCNLSFDLTDGEVLQYECNTTFSGGLVAFATVSASAGIADIDTASTAMSEADASAVIEFDIQAADGSWTRAEAGSVIPAFDPDVTVNWRVTVANSNTRTLTGGLLHTGIVGCDGPIPTLFEIENAVFTCTTPATVDITRYATASFAEGVFVRNAASHIVNAAAPAASVLLKVLDPATGQFVDADRIGPVYIAGSTVRWQITIANTGNVPVSLSELSSGWICDLATPIVLAVNASITDTCSTVESEAITRTVTLDGSGVAQVSNSARITTVVPASIGQRVWIDVDGNDVMSGDERGFGGITVKLLLDGIEVDSTSTADDGSFRFDGLFAGAYVVRYVIPAEYAPTVSSVRIGTAVPNPPPGTFGFSVAVTAGEVRSDANLGLRVPPVPEVTTTTSTTPEEPQPTTPPGPEPTVPPLPTLPFVPPVEQLIGGGELPKTGSDSSDIVATASILLLAGFSLLIATRKRRFQVG